MYAIYLAYIYKIWVDVCHRLILWVQEGSQKCMWEEVFVSETFISVVVFFLRI